VLGSSPAARIDWVYPECNRKASMAEQAVKENHSHIRYLETLLAIECEERDRHAITNRIRRCATTTDESLGGI
jgi:hypothetical protein